jgi:integrase
MSPELQQRPLIDPSTVTAAAPATTVTPVRTSPVRLPRPSDPLKTLALLIAQALSDKLSDGNSDQLLQRLLGPAARTRKRGLSIAKLIDQYLEHADAYYRHPDGTPTGEATSCRHGLSVLRKAFGRTSAEEFRPLKLKAVRERMVERGWCRRSVNHHVNRIKRMFKWAVENELVGPDRYHALRAVSGLQIGRTAAREMPPVKPVDVALVEATLPHLPRQVAAMARLQLLTGMRPGEVCIVRTCDLDRSGDVWVYRPSSTRRATTPTSASCCWGPRLRRSSARSSRTTRRTRTSSPRPRPRRSGGRASTRPARRR